MVAICPKCGRDCRNQPALKLHLRSCDGKLKPKKQKKKKAEVETKVEKEVTTVKTKPFEQQQIELDVPEQETESNFEGLVDDYECSECHNKIEYGVNPCPSCGSELVWE